MGFVQHPKLFDARDTRKQKAMILVVLFVLSIFSTYGISNLQSQSTPLLETPIAQSSHVDLDDIVLTSNVSMTSIIIEMDDAIHSGFQLGLHKKHSCMVNYDSSLYCWGNNQGGRIGVGNNTNLPIKTPVHVLWQDGTEGASATMVAIGDEHSCAILDGATKDLACWGRNGQAQLGVGNNSNSGDWRYTPNNVSVPWGSTSVEALALGNDFSCGLLGNGSVYCWGWNGQGALGDGKNTTPHAEAPQIADLNTSVTAIESGLDHICALSINGSVICWGRNDQGQGNGIDGNGDLDEPSVILLPNGSTGDKWIDLSLGDEHTCALSENNSVYCWGRNENGQLGLGYRNNSGVTIWPPEQVLEVWNSPNSTYPRSLQGGDKHNCVLLSDDSVYCWGRNSAGELGQGNATNGDWTATPQNVSFPGGARIEFIQAGGRHSCAISSTNTVYCWGQNDDGQLGLGNTSNYEAVPIALSIPSTLNWSIHPALPSGLTLNNTTGELSGTPQSPLSKTAFTVFANGSSSQTRSINITINEQPPTISYNSSVYVLTRYQQTHLPISPNSTGGPVVSWAIEPTLPSGLSFGTINGTIFGTPTQLWNSTAYMVWANNSGGSANATLTISVIDQPAILSYNPENMTLTKDLVMTPNVPTITGGVPETLAIVPPLPNGLLFGSNNGTIYGTPTQLLTRTAYTVWANNSGGNSSVQLNITIVDQRPNASYLIDPLHLIINTSHPALPLFPINTGGDVISWQITPPLPTGLKLNATTGAIEGTPTQLLQLTQFTITANNSGGSFDLSLNISVVDLVPNISYNPNNITMTINKPHNAFELNPTISGPGTIASWELSGPLPNGVEFNETTGAFSGTAVELFDETTYTIWGNNSGGSANTTFTLKVVDEVPTISYPNQALVLTNNTESPDLPLEPMVAGNGSIISWAINPSNLPNGLSFGTNNGTVWGIPTELWPKQNYTVTATNTGGEISTGLSITVLDKVPLIWYNHTLLELVIHQESKELPLFAQDDGTGAITSWSISPALPNGLDFGVNNGTIWGVASQLLTTTNYTLIGSNSGGSSITYIDITVVDQLPSMSYEPNAIVLTSHQASPNVLPLEPQIIGNGTLLSWTVSPALPDGLEFGGSNGTIWGIPTQLLPQTQFTVYASNSGGEISTTLFITVVDVPVNFSYSPINLNMTIHMEHPALPLYPITVGPGVPMTWSIEPQLPAGLLFSTTNGSIFGVPTELQLASITYTVWANNSGGPANASVTININPLMEIEYPVLYLVLVQGQSMAPMSPSSTPGVSGQWVVSPDLPVGLMIGLNNGTVSGVPQYHQERMQYTIQFSTVDYGQALTQIFITILPDLDQDGKPDSGYDQGNFTFDDDDDGDGWNNTIELECGSHPQNASSVPKFSGGVCILKSEDDKGWPYTNDLCLPIFIAFLMLIATLFLYRNILLGFLWFTLSLIGLRKVDPHIIVKEQE